MNKKKGVVSFYEVEKALERDDKDKFVCLINNLTSKDEVPLLSFSAMYWSDAVNCAAAVLAGETAGLFDITEADNPLHNAATYSAPRITALLLGDGRFIASTRSDFSTFKNILPLQVVLDKLRCGHNSSETRDSAIDLLTTICRPSNRHVLETVRLLALNTKQLKQEFLNYLNEGKMVEVGALLIVASDQVLSDAGDGFGFKTIMDIHNYLLIKKGKQKESEEMLLLLEIIDRIGDKLAAYIQLDERNIEGVRLQIASLVEDAGFHVKTEDFYGPDICFGPCGLFGREFYTRILDGSRVKDIKNTITTAEVPNWTRRISDEGLLGLDGFAHRPFSTMSSMEHAKSTSHPALALALAQIPPTALIKPSFAIHSRMTRITPLFVASLKRGARCL